VNNEWLDTTLGELLTFSNGASSPERLDHGDIVVFGSNGPIGRANESNASPNTIIIGRVGSYCGSLRFSSESCWVTDNAIRANAKAENSPKFLFYLLQTLNLHAWRGGSGQPLLNQRTLSSIPTTIPHPKDQLTIAAVLGSLDDKIEQNRRTGQALEKLARAVFKAWFLDFEPVKAKAAGQTSFPGMPPETFAALPGRFVGSELGPVPEGWEVKPLTKAFEINPTRQLSKGQDAPYLDMKNMPTDGHAPNNWERRPHGSGMKFINGDTLVARITPCLENGKTAYVDFLKDGEVAWGSTEYIVLRPKPPLPPIFAYCLARMESFREYAIQNMSGTSGRQRVAASSMDHYYIAAPDELIAKSFSELVGPLFACIGAGKAESAKLATLRDYLLPRLLSGRVRVSIISDKAHQ
jgi:type I restriction enzyme S subunit